MNRPRPTPDAMDPALRLFLLQLSNDTHVDIYAFADWIRANHIDLSERFRQCDESSDTDRRVENTQGIWLRPQFKARKVAA